MSWQECLQSMTKLCVMTSRYGYCFHWLWLLVSHATQQPRACTVAMWASGDRTFFRPLETLPVRSVYRRDGDKGALNIAVHFVLSCLLWSPRAPVQPRFRVSIARAVSPVYSLPLQTFVRAHLKGRSILGTVPSYTTAQCVVFCIRPVGVCLWLA